MAKFNETSQGSKTKNLAGGNAYKQSPELELVSILLTSFANSQFYQKAQVKFDRIEKLINAVDAKFAAKAGIFARNEFAMRSISHVLAGEIAPKISGQEWAKNFYEKIVRRPDDMIEIIAYLKSKNNKLPNSLKKGFAKAFDKFDEYQLAKYRAEGKKIKLVDVVNMVHPIPVESNKNALEKLIKGELKSTETWNAKLTKAGQKAETKEQKKELKEKVWKDFVNNPKLEYFALLKNLRNIAEQAPDCIDKACEELTNEKRIKNSLVLPFRFFTAIEELQKGHIDRKIISALSRAAEISLNNIQDMPGKTLIAVDVSGSMHGTPEKIARMFGAVLFKKLNSDLLTFDNNARFCSLNPEDSLLTLTKNIRFTGGGTNFETIFYTAKQKYDRVIILSDMQGWGTSRGYWGGDPSATLRAYRKKYDCNPLVYHFDLQGYGSMQFPEQNVYALAGFSEKVFDIMKLLETDKQALIKTIKAIEL